MPINPVIQAEMKSLVMRAKQLEKDLAKIQEELPMWEKRVDLATQKGMPDLARQAAEKADTMRQQQREYTTQLDVIAQEKDMLRYQARRPSGIEVARSEMMLEEVRLGGLVDPDKAKLERELDELVSFDFDEDDE